MVELCQTRQQNMEQYDIEIQKANDAAEISDAVIFLGDTAWTHWLKVPYISYMDTKAK